MSDKTVCEKIMSIRKKNGYDISICPLCGNSMLFPYRRQNKNGIYIEGCIDASHYIIAELPCGGYGPWFNRKIAIQYRENYLKWLKEHNKRNF
jgi:hypothetical protein